MIRIGIGFYVLIAAGPLTQAADTQSVRQSLDRATRFMVNHIADHGGYAWSSSADGKWSNGEGIAGPDKVWVQPPGTPAVGDAFLDAYEATGDLIHLDAAVDVGNALVAGQLRSGGWGYGIEFDPAKRKGIPYRVGPGGGRDSIAPTPDPGGWDVWRSRKYGTNKTLIDDDTTPASIRFLTRLDQTMEFQDRQIHDAVMYALESTLGAQYPIGAWGHNYDRFGVTPSGDHYPILKASYPESWSRTSTNDFTGCYMINDRATMNMIRTMWLAGETYDDNRFRGSAMDGGEFLLRAQMPEPQPAWAQQYNRHMHPVWDRKFEPPAITGLESQDVLETLLFLFEATGDKRFLEAVGRALPYLHKCVRSDGKLARYYELKTNRQLYFNKQYQLTSDDTEMPDHYGFVVESRLGQIEQRYQRLLAGQPQTPARPGELENQVDAVLKAQDRSGGWLEPGFVRDMEGKKVIPPEGVVQSQTFIDNVRLLCRYLGKP